MAGATHFSHCPCEIEKLKLPINRIVSSSIMPGETEIKCNPAEASG